ncbi:LysR substrate-binding domain-containing protein [Aureimonas sp. SK2]|uniref:LysR substrate-binding domain-containing protein n=1 Tax=Aureimonas sp. SK2 TaxID=3015992 RepID=UPI002443CDAD|nr:LysR substrate-binding domain-containing protein [Aureimonas sp. SK2]
MPHRLDHDLLRTFVTAAESGNLTRAAERLRLSQPTISLQLKRLEQALGCRLIDRSPRSFHLTGEGETLLSYGRRILALADEAIGRLTDAKMTGRVRLGTPEDFATTHLSGVLAAFARAHPGVALEVTTDLTLNLIDRFQNGEFDIVLIKRDPVGPSAGVRVWREPLVWTCAADKGSGFEDPERDLPLVVSPHPCVYRRRALRALDEAGRDWHVVYTSTSLAGAQAAVRAGLGVTVLPAGMVPPDFRKLDGKAGLPPLPEAEIALMLASPVDQAAERLADHIVSSLEREG